MLYTYTLLNILVNIYFLGAEPNPSSEVRYKMLMSKNLGGGMELLKMMCALIIVVSIKKRGRIFLF